ELGGGLAGAAHRVPAGRLAGEALVHVGAAVAGAAHRDVGHAAGGADDAGDAVLPRRPAEDGRLAAAAGEGNVLAAAGEELRRRLVVGVVPHRRLAQVPAGGAEM